MYFCFLLFCEALPPFFYHLYISHSTAFFREAVIPYYLTSMSSTKRFPKKLVNYMEHLLLDATVYYTMACALNTS